MPVAVEFTSAPALGHLHRAVARAQMRDDTTQADVLALICEALLLTIGEDPDREGLRETPARFARAWQEFLAPPPDRLDTAFEAIQSDQLVVLQGHRVYSLCEHHLLPFTCDLTVGYLPQTHVLGVSKLARLADLHARRLQLQERLVADLGRDLAQRTESPHVAVLGRGVHLCMAMRGARSQAPLVTSYLTGAFRDQPACRAEFFALANDH